MVTGGRRTGSGGTSLFCCWSSPGISLANHSSLCKVLSLGRCLLSHLSLLLSTELFWQLPCSCALSACYDLLIRSDYCMTSLITVLRLRLLLFVMSPNRSYLLVKDSRTKPLIDNWFEPTLASHNSITFVRSFRGKLLSPVIRSTLATWGSHQLLSMRVFLRCANVRYVRRTSFRPFKPSSFQSARDGAVTLQVLVPGIPTRRLVTLQML
jgi:hypothetical protein